ncbi:hypothetical protein PanWU01x14_020290 [Parasponia andersonii]|uniref:Retrotransposon gag protein n=1 Tax=Parasponia andersonii TaxID=3476 RepID=A0A2P5DYL7_PARAD|nr:hypothetical protein PanWU01x14_020290 [Parasponia andersonii]
MQHHELQNQEQPSQEKKLSIEEILKLYITKNKGTLQNQAATMITLETQLGQMTSAMTSAMTNHPQGALPSNTEVNLRNQGKKYCNYITLRSRKKLLKTIDKSTSPSKPTVEEVVEEEQAKENDEEKPIEEVSSGSSSTSLSKPCLYNPSLPFPQCFQKKNLDKKFSKFLEVLKQLHINILFAEALEQMPSYVKFMKEILSKKKRLGEFETGALTEEYSTILQNKLPPKL